MPQEKRENKMGMSLKIIPSKYNLLYAPSFQTLPTLQDIRKYIVTPELE